MIDEIISENPKICFIDWFSTAIIITDYVELCNYLDVIVRKLMLINTKIIFLLFDSLPLDEKRILMYNNIIKYSDEYSIDYLKLYNNENVNELLRDNVHTNEQGSLFYATKIYEFYLDLQKSLPCCINSDAYNSKLYTKIPSENKYFDIKKINVNKIVNKKILLEGYFELIGIYQILGLFSGIVEIIIDDNKKQKCMIWDLWCYYERKNFKIKSDIFAKKIEINILQDSFDYKLCKENVNYDNYEKYMNIIDIYYIGDLNIIKID
jgi:hypothetical protein